MRRSSGAQLSGLGGAPDGSAVRLKLLLLGETCVGKTCLMLRFAEPQLGLARNVGSTVGIDFKKKSVLLGPARRACVLEIWDTAGQERFASIGAAYMRGAHGIAVCYDVSRRSSFERVSYWVGRISERAAVDVDRVLIACKSDVDAAMREVSESEGRELAERCGMRFFETSALSGAQVDAAFLSLAESVFERLSGGADGLPPVSGSSTSGSSDSVALGGGAAPARGAGARSCGCT